MEFRMLGPLEVREQGRQLPLGGSKQRSLLGVLLLHANDAVSSERLVDELWGARPPEAARKLVQGYVSRLRKLLGPGRLATRQPGYLVRLETGELDLHEFERRSAAARAEQEPQRAAALWREALELWRGPALADLRFEGFAGRGGGGAAAGAGAPGGGGGWCPPRRRSSPCRDSTRRPSRRPRRRPRRPS